VKRQQPWIEGLLLWVHVLVDCNCINNPSIVHGTVYCTCVHARA